MTFSRVVAALIDARDQSRCVVCRRWDDGMHRHHRKLRSRGGEHIASNGILLCPIHHEHVHSHPLEATIAGLMVPSWGIPRRTPVAWWWPDLSRGTVRRGFALLDDLGGVTEVPDPDYEAFVA